MGGEFYLIDHYFKHCQFNRKEIITGIGDDAALVVAPGGLLALSTDTLVSGVHFFADIDPADLAYKSLAVNLSDMAAMGAKPYWALLALTLPSLDESWLECFSHSLRSQLEKYNVSLIGGDVTRGPLSLTYTVLGTVPPHAALKRSGAHIGDVIYVTGTLGDSAAGLALLRRQLHVSDSVYAYFLEHHLRPKPRLAEGQALQSIASAAIDISDGLLADLQHILLASSCGANIYLDKLPISSALLNSVSLDKALEWALVGGEDYELCFTLPHHLCTPMEQRLASLGVEVTFIGEIVNTSGIQLWQNGQKIDKQYQRTGYDHFFDKTNSHKR